MLSFIFRALFVGAIFSSSTIAFADEAPEICETHPNSYCPVPAEQYRYPKFGCPTAIGIKCTVLLPQAVLSCESNVYGDTFCQAWPQGADPALHYAWHSSNPRVILDAGDSPMQFLSCDVNANTTVSVTISDDEGRATSAAVLARCKVVAPGNPNNQLPQ